jgi:hypothetical protein
MANYVDHLITFLVGLYATGVGYGWLASPARGPSAANWQRRFGPLLRLIGPTLLVIAVGLMVAEYMRAGGR